MFSFVTGKGRNLNRRQEWRKSESVKGGKIIDVQTYRHTEILVGGNRGIGTIIYGRVLIKKEVIVDGSPGLGMP